MTDARIVEFQRLSMVRQQEHLDEALRRMREAERRAVERELAHEHNRTLLALLDRARRESATLRRELHEIRAMLDDAPSITEPGGFAGVQTGEPR